MPCVVKVHMGELHMTTSRGRLALSYNSCGKNRICSGIQNHIFGCNYSKVPFYRICEVVTSLPLRQQPPFDTESTTIQCLCFTEVISNSNHQFVAVNASHWHSLLGREDQVNLYASRLGKMKFRVAACARCSHCSTTTSQVRKRQRWHGWPRISPA